MMNACFKAGNAVSVSSRPLRLTRCDDCGCTGVGLTSVFVILDFDTLFMMHSFEYLYSFHVFLSWLQWLPLEIITRSGSASERKWAKMLRNRSKHGNRQEEERSD